MFEDTNKLQNILNKIRTTSPKGLGGPSHDKTLSKMIKQ